MLFYGMFDMTLQLYNHAILQQSEMVFINIGFLVRMSVINKPWEVPGGSINTISMYDSAVWFPISTEGFTFKM